MSKIAFCISNLGITIGKPSSCVFDEVDEGIFEAHDMENNELKGYKIFDVKELDSKLRFSGFGCSLSTRESERFSVQKKPFGFFCIQKSKTKCKDFLIF